MKRWYGLLGAVAILAFTSGCAPKPEKVCKHLIKVYGNAADKPAYMEDVDHCVTYYEGKKKRRGVNSYRREVLCILKSDTEYQVRRCVEKENARQ